MNHKHVIGALAALALGCAGGQAAGTGAAKPQTTTEQQRITNVSPFDLATCFPRSPTVPDRVNDAVLVGLVVANRPQVMECLVNPAHRGPEKDTKVTLSTTLKEAGGLEHKITGANLTADGEACIRQSLEKAFAAYPSLNKPQPKGQGDITAPTEFQHVAGTSPTVTFGMNAGNDRVGAIRLAQGGWCDCFQPWKSAPPRQFKAAFTFEEPAGVKGEDGKETKPTEAVPTKAVVDPTGDATADQVGACLQGKLAAMKFQSVVGAKLDIPYRFVIVHSGISEALPEGTAPEVQFTQLDLLRGQAAADAAIAIGARTSAVMIYDGLVKDYQKTQNYKLVPELKSKCQELLKSDDQWSAAIERQLATDRQTLELATTLVATNPDWGEVQKAAQEQVAATEKDLEGAKGTRASDSKVCPKETYEEKKAPAKKK